MELQKLLEQAANQWGLETVQAILAKLDTYPIQFNGTLRRSILYEEVEPFNLKFFMADYGQFQDEGVDGTDNSVGSQFKFKGNYFGTAFAIQQWATAKGLNAYATARSIQEKGIKPRPFFKSVIETRLPDLEVVINDTYQKYLDETINKINNQQK